MKAEIIAIGTELLLGQIANTNGQYIAEQCANNGIDLYYQTVVGDNVERIKQAFSIAKSRADLIIVTGGLGPTQDDLTKDALADFIGSSLVLHQHSMDKIIEVFRSRGQHMVESNVKQAMMVEECVPLTNETGLAVGIALTHEGTHYILLPGPPREMIPMFSGYAIPWLRTVIKEEMPLYSRMLKFAGIGESTLEHQLLDLIEVQQDPTIAPYAKEGEVLIRLTTRAKSEAEATVKMEATEREIYSRFKQYLYANRDVPLEVVVVEKLIESGKILAVAESCTGGKLSDMITSVPASSVAFKGAVISYTNALKKLMLGISADLLEGEDVPGAVSEQTAKQMAENILVLTDADFALSITGVAGPAESEGKTVGLVYIGLAEKGTETVVFKTQQVGNREIIKFRSAKTALFHLWKRLSS